MCQRVAKAETETTIVRSLQSSLVSMISSSSRGISSYDGTYGSMPGVAARFQFAPTPTKRTGAAAAPTFSPPPAFSSSPPSSSSTETMDVGAGSGSGTGTPHTPRSSGDRHRTPKSKVGQVRRRVDTGEEGTTTHLSNGAPRKQTRRVSWAGRDGDDDGGSGSGNSSKSSSSSCNSRSWVDGGKGGDAAREFLLPHCTDSDAVAERFEDQEEARTQVHLVPFKSAATMTAAMAAAASPNAPEAPSGPSQPPSAAESLFNNSLFSSASAPTTTRLFVDLYPAEVDILSPQAGEYYVSIDPMDKQFEDAVDRAMGGHFEAMSAGGGPGEFGQGATKEGEIHPNMWDLEEQIYMWDRRHAAGNEGSGGAGEGVRMRVDGGGHGVQQGGRTGSRHSI